MDINQLVCNNQSIKIVPSIEDSLKSMGLNVDLDDVSKAWLEQLKVTWATWKKTPAVEYYIESFFQSQTDPFRLALIFVINCDDYKECKPKSLPYLIIEILQKWSQSSGILPEDNLKLPAFHIATHQRNHYFVSVIVKTYQLVTVKDKILPIVKDMIRSDNCKQASQIIIAMQLSEYISVESLLFPLVLQDKSNLIDEYLTACPNQVKPMVLFLDKLLDKTISIREFVQNYIDENKISHVKYDKVHHKPLGKLVARLCNKFNIPIETCKNLSKNRTTGGLRYLIYQKYHEHNVSSTVWEDLVKDSLKQNASSGQEFIDMLVDYDRNEALKWASYLNMPEDILPLALKEITLNDVPEVDNWDTNVATSQKYYKFSLPEDQIYIINTIEDFYNIMIPDMVNTSVASIDCEWKPSFGATQSQVALIQVATMNKVYLIDALILNKPEYSTCWTYFYKSFLDNAEIIKIGFGLEQDLKEVKATVAGLGNIKVQGEGLLDLGVLWKSLISNGLIIPGNSDNGGNSLSSLVQSCFGLPLEKSEQCSNWELRPLRNTQVIYAAMDAHVLLEIYNVLQKLCMEQDINFEEICNEVMLESKKKCSKKTKVVDRLQSSLPMVQPRPANEVKFLVEHGLSGLMPHLRYCGMDTIVIPTEMLWHDVINLAISEDRFIILSKLKYTPYANFPQSYILELSKNGSYKQLKKVLYHFNITFEQDNLFSFCINCNSKNLTKLDAEEVAKMCKEYEAVSSSNEALERYNDYEDELGYTDNFLSDSDGDDDLYQPDVHYKKKLHTKMDVPVEIYKPNELSTSNKPAILCEACGKLFWDEDKLLKPIRIDVYNISNIKIL